MKSNNVQWVVRFPPNGRVQGGVNALETPTSSFPGEGIAQAGALTHPDIVSLVDPLFAARKEGDSVYNINFILSINPLYAKGEERVVQRSADRVSQNMWAND